MEFLFLFFKSLRTRCMYKYYTDYDVLVDGLVDFIIENLDVKLGYSTLKKKIANFKYDVNNSQKLGNSIHYVKSPRKTTDKVNQKLDVITPLVK